MTTIFVDFDGTITEHDLLDRIAQTFGDPEVYAEVDRGLDERRLTLHEVLRREFEPVTRAARRGRRAGCSSTRSCARASTSSSARTASGAARLVVLSSGFRELIEPVLEREGLGGARAAGRTGSTRGRPAGEAHFRDTSTVPRVR